MLNQTIGEKNSKSTFQSATRCLGLAPAGLVTRFSTFEYF